MCNHLCYSLLCQSQKKKTITKHFPFAEFDSYSSLPLSDCSSSITYESATNELPLSAISLASFPETPTDAPKSNLTAFYSSCCALPNGGMSPLATNERPLSCTCLPKLLTEGNECYSNCATNEANVMDNEPPFVSGSNVQLSSSDPLPRGSYFEQLETQSFSQNFIERLNKLHNSRRDPKLFTPKILLNDSIVKPSDYRTQKKRSESMRCASSNPLLTITHNAHSQPITITTSHSCQITVTPADSIACSTDDTDHVTHTHTNHTTNPPPPPPPPLQITRIVNATEPINKSTTNTTATTRTSVASISVKPLKICTTRSMITSTTSTSFTNVNNPTIPHPNNVKTHNSDATQTTTPSTTRRQRHSIAGQMGFFKIMDIAGGFSRKMTTSTNSLFSTAVISGSSSAPNLRDMIPNTASPSGRNFF